MFNEKLNFGKYKNKSVLEIWKGQRDKITPTLLKNFIKEIIDFFFGLTDFNKLVLSTGYSFSPKEVEFVEYLFKNPELRDSIDIINGKIQIKNLEDSVTEDFTSLIIKFFNYSHFTEPQFNALKNPENHNSELVFNDVSNSLANCIPDPKYINWCLNETDELENIKTNLNDLIQEDSYYPIIVLTKLTDKEINYNLYYHIQVHS